MRTLWYPLGAFVIAGSGCTPSDEVPGIVSAEVGKTCVLTNTTDKPIKAGLQVYQMEGCGTSALEYPAETIEPEESRTYKMVGTPGMFGCRAVRGVELSESDGVYRLRER